MDVLQYCVVFSSLLCSEQPVGNDVHSQAILLLLRSVHLRFGMFVSPLASEI
ncbi:hypothetical protein DAI22_11g008900 [Oryza sativa Japonica Group]|nr:hypothetical protein DAI22_11g008900 [Oryza sativa Japonica Group]